MRFRLRALLCLLVLAVLVLVFRGVPAAAISPGPNQVQAKAAPLPVIFFDLGNVLIDTTNATAFHFTNGGQAYLNELLASGYTLGLISNIPQSWGTTQDEKFAKLKAYVAQNWTESAPFPWADFTYVLLPPSDALRKPNPYLFNEAMSLAGSQAAGPCAPVYQGESPDEIAVAQQIGFFAYLTSAPIPTGVINFAPLDQLFCRPFPSPTPVSRRPQGDS